MKAKVLRLKLLVSILFFALPVITAGVFYYIHYKETKEEEEEEEFEERDGIPGILKQMDLWSEMRTYPNKTMDASSFVSSFELAKAMAKPQLMNGPMAPATAPWTELGPMNFSGRILSIGFHPTDANKMWVGSASGGLFKTTTGGSGGPGGISWQYVPTGFPVLGIASIAVNPSNGNEIYIGTGEVYSGTTGGSTGAGHYRLFRGSYGIGILKSTDDGATWTKTLDFTNSSLKGVMDLLIHPTIPSTVFAATTDGIYRTTNSGTSWTLIHNVTFAMDLCFKPGNPDVLYVGCGNFQSPGTGIYKTTNANAATPTFNQLTSAALPNPISGKIHLAISANNPNRVYASIGRDPNTAHTQGLYVSTNEGSTWAAAGAASIIANQGWYAHDVAVSSTDATRILWGELNTFISTNGGSSTSQTGTWSLWDINNTTVGDLTEGTGSTTGYTHADVHRIERSPHDATGNTFFLCTDGGLFRTTNGGSNFNTLNGGLNTAQIYANMSVHPTNANYMLCGLQDNEAMVYEGSQGCRRIGNLGDGFHAAMNSSGTIQLVESYYFNRRRSTNSGASWGGGSGAVAELACFNVPMVFSRVPGSAYMFAGSIYFKRSTNSGSTWTNLNSGVAIAGVNNPAIAMEAPTNDIVYFSTGPGGGVRNKLWKTTNATAANPSFTEITGTLPDRYYSGIDVDPSDPNRLVVSLSGFGSSHVYLSVDGGATWSDMGGGLPDIPHNTIFINPGNRGQVYVGNDLGVFFAKAVPIAGPLGGTTSVNWVNYSEGLGDATMIGDIAITSTNKLRIGTYGRGIWERDLAPSTLPVVIRQFKASSVANGNQLSWVVTAQENLSHFEVEYNNGGSSFISLAKLPAKTGGSDLVYSYKHMIGTDADIYYRLKIVDLDGSVSYSGVELVKAQKPITKLAAYPNPTAGNFSIRFHVRSAGMADIKLYNAEGRLVLSEKQTVQSGNNILPMDISRLPAGNYQLVCETDKSISVTKIIKR